MNTKDKRIIIYDWLRLIATIYVVIGHSAYLNIQTAWGGVEYKLTENINPVYYSAFLNMCRNLPNWIYGFHMSLFFCLSGAVFALGGNDKSLDDIIKSKIRRLLFPYFVYSWLFVIPIKYFAGFYREDTIYNAMLGVLTLQESSHLWFLPALFLFCNII